MADWSLIADLAGRQHFVVATWQLMMLAISKKALAERVSRHGWHRRHRGVLALPGPDDPIRHLAAAVLAYSRPPGAAERVRLLQEQGADFLDALTEAALGCGQAVCGPSALWLYGLARWDKTPWLRLPRGCGNATRGAVGIRHGDPTGPVGRIQGLPVVDVDQAFLDLPGCLRRMSGARLHHHLTSTLAAADARRLTDADALGARLDRVGRILGASALRAAVIDCKGQLSHSATERKARQIVAEVATRLGVSLHPRPYGIDYAGRRVAEADLAIVDQRLDIEIDGPHHLLPAQRRKDDVRDRYVRRARWEVERFSTEMVDLRPVVFAARVEDVVRFRMEAMEALSRTPSSPGGNQRM